MGCMARACWLLTGRSGWSGMPPAEVAAADWGTGGACGHLLWWWPWPCGARGVMGVRKQAAKGSGLKASVSGCRLWGAAAKWVMAPRAATHTQCCTKSQRPPSSLHVGSTPPPPPHTHTAPHPQAQRPRCEPPRCGSWPSHTHAAQAAAVAGVEGAAGAGHARAAVPPRKAGPRGAAVHQAVLLGLRQGRRGSRGCSSRRRHRPPGRCCCGRCRASRLSSGRLRASRRARRCCLGAQLRGLAFDAGHWLLAADFEQFERDAFLRPCGRRAGGGRRPGRGPLPCSGGQRAGGGRVRASCGCLRILGLCSCWDGACD